MLTLYSVPWCDYIRAIAPLSTLSWGPWARCLFLLWWGQCCDEHLGHIRDTSLGAGGMFLGMDTAGVGVCIASVFPDIARIAPTWLFIDFNYTIHFSLLLFSFFFLNGNFAALLPGCHLPTALPWRTTCLSCTDSWVLTMAPSWFPEWTPVFPKHDSKLPAGCLEHGTYGLCLSTDGPVFLLGDHSKLNFFEEMGSSSHTHTKSVQETQWPSLAWAEIRQAQAVIFITCKGESMQVKGDGHNKC